MRRNSDGFTIIELLFAMTFVAVLLVLILTASLQITRIYDKGITLKQVNQAGADLGTELQRSLKSANAPLTAVSTTAGQQAYSRGRLCLGSFSYVWNLQNATDNKYSGADASTRIGLVKVNDTSGSMCTVSGGSYPPVDRSQATELILGTTTGGVGLQLRSLSIEQKANSGINYVYSVSYTISTDDNASIASNRCIADAGNQFCALNDFNFSVFMRQGGNGSV